MGTKLKLAIKAGIYEGLGCDLVAMNVNDLVCCGATPLFFLDYIACARLDFSIVEPAVKGMADACNSIDCAIIGGETAEMPGVYAQGEFDLAGFSVGIVDEKELIDGEHIAEGDAIIGLPSSGIHSNGFSLVRRIIDEHGHDIFSPFGDMKKTLGEALLKPTRLYVKQALKVASSVQVHGMSHITGGGLDGNIRRLIKDSLDLRIEWGDWPEPEVFGFIRANGVGEEEMRRVFNMGVGFCFIVPSAERERCVAMLREMGESPFCVGDIIRKD